MQIGFLSNGSQVWNRLQLQGVARTVRRQKGVRLLLLPGSASFDRLLSQDMKGFIGSAPPEMLAPLHNLGVLTMNLARHRGQPVGGELWTDYQTLADMALEHLTERGCSRIACFGTWDHRHPNPVDMREALWRAIRKRKLQPLGDFTPPGPPHPWTLAGQIQEVADWLLTLPLPFGLVTTDSTHAGRALESIRIAGLTVPGDVRVLSMDNDSAYLECCTPSISHMHLNQAEKGARAAELLLEMLEGKRESNFRELKAPSGVLPLQSTAYATPHDPQLQRALDVLEHWEYQLPSVEDLAQAAGMSRSTLFRRMEQQIGKKPGELLYQARREKALQLLREGGQHLAEVADLCGYSLPSQLTHDIKKHTGQTPKQYRESWQMG